MATQNKTWERWSDEEVSALLAIYSEDATQQLLLKPVPNSVGLRWTPGLRVAVYAVKLFAACQ